MQVRLKKIPLSLDSTRSVELTCFRSFFLSSGAKPTPKFEKPTTIETPSDGSLDLSTVTTDSSGREGSRR